MISEVQELPIAIGSISCLNVTAGDITIKFDKEDVEETKKAKQMIADMLKRGYCIFVEDHNKETGEKVLRKVKRFCPTKEVYIVKELTKDKATGKMTKKEKNLPMRKHKATGIAPRSGG